jgi:hypothetical protein
MGVKNTGLYHSAGEPASTDMLATPRPDSHVFASVFCHSEWTYCARPWPEGMTNGHNRTSGATPICGHARRFRPGRYWP